MLALYAAEGPQTERILAVLPDQPVVVLAAWSDFERKGPAAHCSLVVSDWLGSGPVVSNLAAYKARHPQHPIILVTRWDPENARMLKDVQVEEVVWMREVEQDLPGVVRRTCAHELNLVRCLALPFEQADCLPPTLRRALAHACRSERPVRSVNQLAATMGCDRRTLWHQWNRAFGSGAPLRLQDVLHWLLLLRAVGSKTQDRSWTAVAEKIGVHPDTLWRMARQLAGRTLPEVAAMGPAELATKFRGDVLGMIIQDDGSDIV